MNDLRQNDQAHWLFYDHSSQEQKHAKVLMVKLNQEEQAHKVWQSIPPITGVIIWG